MKRNSFTSAAASARAYSPYLTRLLAKHAWLPEALEAQGPEAVFSSLLQALEPQGLKDSGTPELMQRLRVAKQQAALAIALSDISGAWVLPQVTHALSQFADVCVSACITHLLNQAKARGEISRSAAQECGLMVLGMGKLGAWELNYSSDIDLILFYEPERVGYRGRRSEQHFFNRLSQDLVQLLQERTRDGYVFRTDLRLRPDPAAMPPAVSLPAALAYYESVGQNWERAALIKSRVIAGDMKTGELFLQQIVPFIWRKYLDFAAIQDIHSIKRQMDARTGGEIGIAGHNIKTGVGGIREIEFFTQVHQLIWGGKKPELRLRGTVEALGALARGQLIEADACTALIHAYWHLRNVEHRLQMIDDQQTHTLPSGEQELESLARFMDYADAPAFAEATLVELTAVHGIFAGAFKPAPTLGDEGNLMFTGVTPDPDTLSTLRRMGFAEAGMVAETVMGWHHGSRRATRTKRARELLTELMPALLKALAATPDPDAALRKFDGFLKPLPAGVQLFSLFNANPHLLELIADILGSSPVLAEQLSRHPQLLESVLEEDFYAALPPREMLCERLDVTLTGITDIEAQLDAVRRFTHERQFQAGVQLLQGICTPESAGVFLADLAQTALERLLALIEEDFARIYGRIPGARFCVLALGRLGERMMTLGSDLDLIFVYDTPDMEAYSDGSKRFTASVYYNRLAPRVMHALTSLSPEGRMYEVDTRLRPFGTQGLSAVSLPALTQYFEQSAWSFEVMALLKARAVAGDALLCNHAEAQLKRTVSRPWDAASLRREVMEMRARVAQEFPSSRRWDVKHAAGGLLELEFLQAYLKLACNGTLPETLQLAASFLFQLLSFTRLLTTDAFVQPSTPASVTRRLAHAMRMADAEALEAELIAVENRIHSYYVDKVETAV